MSIFSGKFRRVVFIVSSGRTGTKALAHHLDKCYPDVRALHEPTPSWRLRRCSAMALAGRLTRRQLVDRLASARRALVERCDRPIYIESNPFLAGFIEAFGDVFDSPLVLHVVRDPRSYVRSTLNWGSFRGIKLLASRLVPYWVPKPEHRPDNRERRWSQMSRVEELAWYWKTVNTALSRGQAIYGERYRCVRFEDLFARDGSGLKRFVEWAGLPWKPELAASANSENVNASSVQACPQWDRWPDAWRDELLHHCRDLMIQYGYDPSGPVAGPSSGSSTMAVAVS